MLDCMTIPTDQSVTTSNSPMAFHTGGGAVIDGMVTAGGDVIGRDQINITIHQTVQVVSAEPLPLSDLHLLNFGRPLSEYQRNQIEQALGFRISRVIAKQVEFKEAEDFGPQVAALLDGIGFTPQEWQTIPLLVNPPGFAPAAVCLLSELHGRLGHFPTVIRSRPAPAGTMQQYTVAEIINLQALRDAARRRSQS
jgi:hypothetical protein